MRTKTEGIDSGRVVARPTSARSPTSSARQPMKVRPAVLDHSDLSWMSKGAVRRTPALERAIAETLDFIRADTELP